MRKAHLLVPLPKPLSTLISPSLIGTHLFPRILELLKEELPHRRHKLYRQIDESFRYDERYAV